MALRCKQSTITSLHKAMCQERLTILTEQVMWLAGVDCRNKYLGHTDLYTTQQALGISDRLHKLGLVCCGLIFGSCGRAQLHLGVETQSTQGPESTCSCVVLMWLHTSCRMESRFYHCQMPADWAGGCTLLRSIRAEGQSSNASWLQKATKLCGLPAAKP